MEQFRKACKEQLEDIRFDEITRRIYSVDASIFEVEPAGVFFPKNIAELRRGLKIAYDYQIPVIARGAGTGITGGCLGSGLVIDTSKHLHSIRTINITEEYVVCEPGVVQDRLNEELLPFGYRLGPDTSTGNRATIGGMLGNNAAGARSLYYGRMVDHVESVDLVLSGGEVITFSKLSPEEFKNKCNLQTHEGSIYRAVMKIIEEYADDIANHFPKIPRHVSGYNLDELLNSESINLSKVIAGSEGTLGIAASMKLRIAKRPTHAGICVIHLSNIHEGFEQIEKMLLHKPAALELIDKKIITAGHSSPVMRNRLPWLTDDPEGLILAEFSGNSPDEIFIKCKAFAEMAKKEGIGYKLTTLTAQEEMQGIWDLRKSGLGLLLSKRSYSRAIAFIEDMSIAPEKLAAFMKKFCAYLKNIGKEAGIYGHIGSGCMHIRPYIDLRDPNELLLMEKIMREVSDMVLEFSGAMSGEHGDGLIRSWLNEKMFGERVALAFLELKQAFDPHHLMNPGKITHGPPVTEHLRLDPNTPLQKISTFLDFSEEGGFELAVDLCNGNGQCRKKENVMCPSFQATGDEYDTTRARAEALRGIIHGKLSPDEFTGKGLYDVMDLCIECKGCKKECPSLVDMAKIKSEFLFQYQQKHGIPLRSRIFAYLHAINRFLSPLAMLYNFMGKTPVGKYLSKSIGIAPERSLPVLAKEPFSAWFKKNSASFSQGFSSVALFDDTYMEYHEPAIGIAACKVLRALGYRITLVRNICCGRPMISKGMLKQARDKSGNLLQVLLPFAEKQIPIIGIEPSCISAIADDYKGLASPLLQEQYKKVSSHFVAIEDFLHKHIEQGQLRLKLKQGSQKGVVHGHCHQKSLWGTRTTLELLRSVGIEPAEIHSGCCGMAGSFGYEKEHYDLSMAIGELALLPAIRKVDKETLIVANGFSCRSQIEHGSGRKAIHVVEAIAARMVES